MSLHKYRIEFLLRGEVHAWEQFAGCLPEALGNARRSLVREYPSGREYPESEATLLFVREVAA
jgi:hypothetical protein